MLKRVYDIACVCTQSFIHLDVIHQKFLNTIPIITAISNCKLQFNHTPLNKATKLILTHQFSNRTKRIHTLTEAHNATSGVINNLSSFTLCERDGRVKRTAGLRHAHCARAQFFHCKLDIK
jgi:hypothetical protein